LLTLFAVSAGCELKPEYSAAKAVLDPYRSSVTQVVALLEQGDEAEAVSALDELHGAVIEARAILTGQRFSGATDTLSDPFALPAGTYRATVHGDGSPWVKVIPVAAPDDYDYVMIGAEDGSSALYVSDGARIMLEFSVVSGPYELVFERIE